MFCSVFILTNRFHAAVGLNSNRSQTPTNMESICYGKVTICNTNVMQFLSQVKILLKLLRGKCWRKLVFRPLSFLLFVFVTCSTSVLAVQISTSYVF